MRSHLLSVGLFGVMLTPMLGDLMLHGLPSMRMLRSDGCAA